MQKSKNAFYDCANDIINGLNVMCDHDVFQKHLKGKKKGCIKYFYFGVWMIPFYDRVEMTIIGKTVYLNSLKGVYILPKDGSYVRFISNNWYS